ncbi:MAG: radical SAM protein [Candidatus Pacebacteria bacterium]|jgi:MoaA/NifB/PqqE/SkfB family radical SAM enzyme|nr:radical SAM protein [Candidatus Paceibacterota bacterium]
MKPIIKKLITGQITPGQVINYAKYKFLPRGPRLFYDPIELSIHVTNRCTYACDMCQTHSKKIKHSGYNYPGGRDIDFETFRRFADRFRNAQGISFIGTGEPLLNPDFFKMVRYAVFERKMNAVTVSNGTVLDDKINDVLECGLAAIEISVDGHNEEEFFRMTGQPREFHAKVRENVIKLVAERNARKSQLEITFSYILDRQNVKDIFKMIDYARQCGVDGATFHNFLPSPSPGFTAEERSLFRDDADAVKILDQVKKGDCGLKINMPTLLDRNRRERYCADYFRLIRVDGEGDVGGCTGQILNMRGNGKFYDKDVWNNAHFQERRRDFLDKRRPELAPCRTCPCNNI